MQETIPTLIHKIIQAHWHAWQLIHQRVDVAEDPTDDAAVLPVYLILVLHTFGVTEDHGHAVSAVGAVDGRGVGHCPAVLSGGGQTGEAVQSPSDVAYEPKSRLTFSPATMTVINIIGQNMHT